MRFGKQIAAISALVLGFAAFDSAVYGLFTKRYRDGSSAEMHAKSVEVSAYLPFTENSGIVRSETELRLTGELPVIDGAAALFPVFSAYVNAVYPPQSVQYDGKDFSQESALHFSNTRGAYQAVVDGTADVIFCAQPSEEQLGYAAEHGVTLELVPIGKEAFVFLVNQNNPVNDLTVEQVRGIYAGEYKKWSEVGGEDVYIDALQRNTGSGSQTAMLSFMGGTKMRRNLLGFTGTPIGYSFRYYVEGLTGAEGVKMLSLNGVYPDAQSIADGSYPVASSFYAVYDAANPNENIPLLLDFILSEEGQRILAESGYVPLTAQP